MRWCCHLSEVGVSLSLFVGCAGNEALEPARPKQQNDDTAQTEEPPEFAGTCSDNPTHTSSGWDIVEMTGSCLDSCYLVNQGICYEFCEYPKTIDWCDCMGSKYDSPAQYHSNACAGLGPCLFVVGGDFEFEADAYYSELLYDGASAEAACIAAGGIWDGGSI